MFCPSNGLASVRLKLQKFIVSAIDKGPELLHGHSRLGSIAGLTASAKVFNAVSFHLQACVLTVACGDEVVDLQVYGKKRDNEISKLLQNVAVGSIIEFPANVKDKASLSARNLNPVKTCTILKVK